MLHKLIILISMMIMFAGCSRRAILIEANPSLDPAPADKISFQKSVDPMAAKQWNMTKVSADQVWATQPSTSRRIVVALLGTGVDYTHPDLANNIFVNKSEWKELTPGKQTPADREDDDKNGYVDDFVGYDFVENDGLPFDRNGAGTAIAGVIGAVGENGEGIRGVVPELSMMPIRFIDNSGQFLLPNFISALKYAVKMKVDVIHIHLPSYVFGASADFFTDPVEAAKIERAMVAEVLKEVDMANIPLVLSAGNSGQSLQKSGSLLEELKKHGNVIVVTSVDLDDKRPAVANYGRTYVETSAPGYRVVTTLPGGEYGEVSSTSLAAAHVTGALALAINKHFGKKTISELLKTFLRPEASDSVEAMQFETVGGNRLNISKYLDYLEKN